MSWAGDKASRALDNAQPQSLLGKAAVAAAKGIRAVDRRTGGDKHNHTQGDPYLCHMRARRKGKECGNKLDTSAKYEQGHCGHHICAKEHTAFTTATDRHGNPLFDERFDTTRRVVKRW